MDDSSRDWRRGVNLQTIATMQRVHLEKVLSTVFAAHKLEVMGLVKAKAATAVRLAQSRGTAKLQLETRSTKRGINATN